MTAQFRQGRAQQVWPNLDQVVAGLAAALEAVGDVVGQRQAALHDTVAVMPELQRARLQFRQFPEHIGNVGILRRRP